MKCEDCELRMAEFDFGGGIEAHLRVCPECRALAGELRENAVALSAMREEELPVVERPPASQAKACATLLPNPTVRKLVVTAAAALVVLAIALPWHRKAAVIVPPSRPVVAAVPAPAPPIAAVAALRKPRRKLPRPALPTPEETLMVKMLTPDPDVVIYWIIEPKEKSE